MKTAAILAVSGLTAIASAQTATVNLTHNDADSVINVGETVTWTMTIEFTGGEVVSGINMRIDGDNALGTSSAFAYQETNGGNNGGASNGAGIAFVNMTNSLFLESFNGGPANRDNPLTIGSFDFTAGAEGTLTYSVVRGEASSAFLTVAPNAFGDLPLTAAEASFNIQSLSIVPTPASAALLGLGGLVATRRRR